MEEKNYGTATDGAHVKKLADEGKVEDDSTVAPAVTPKNAPPPLPDVKPHTPEGKIIDPFKDDKEKKKDKSEKGPIDYNKLQIKEEVSKGRFLKGEQKWEQLTNNFIINL